MMQAEVVTGWAQVGEDGTTFNVPQIVQALRDNGFGWSRMQDTTEQSAENILPDPNLHTRFVVAEDDAITLLENDDRFEVLWSEPI